jgi:long-chain acyl-CoA synthetase
MHKTWLAHDPGSVSTPLRTDAATSLVALLDSAFARHAALPACRFMGRSFSFAEIDAQARALAAYLQGLGLERGERVALMLPNVPQYAVAVAAILRAGGVVVNLDARLPLRELQHQLKDSGARAAVVLENDASALQALLDAVPRPQVILASLGDMLGNLKGVLVNHAARRTHKLLPQPELPDAVRFNDALAQGRGRRCSTPAMAADDIAVLQYTAGTTGPSKGVVLLHRNLVANVLQGAAWSQPAWQRVPPGQQPTLLCALPLHHLFGFTANLLLGLHLGGCNLLVADVSDVDAVLKALAQHRPHGFAAMSSMFDALVERPAFAAVDCSALVLAVACGMAVRRDAARLWLQTTGCRIVEAYGLAETSAWASCNAVDGSAGSGHIGLPLPGTELALLDDAGHAVGSGMAGEIAVRGPQVMAGYWQHPDETARAMTRDGFVRTGDIGRLDERGGLQLVGRKKDTISVGGIDVYPDEIEDRVRSLPGVQECAAFGMPDGPAGQAVKLVVVRREPGLSEAELRRWCEASFSGVQQPKCIEFRDALPRSAIGKVLRRELRAARA